MVPTRLTLSVQAIQTIQLKIISEIKTLAKSKTQGRSFKATTPFAVKTMKQFFSVCICIEMNNMNVLTVSKTKILRYAQLMQRISLYEAAINPVFKFTWYYADLELKKHFLLLMLKLVVLLNIFVESAIYIFPGFFDDSKVQDKVKT